VVGSDYLGLGTSARHLVVDETGFVKKGTRGAARQYCGTAGPCQDFLGYASAVAIRPEVLQPVESEPMSQRSFAEVEGSGPARNHLASVCLAAALVWWIQ